MNKSYFERKRRPTMPGEILREEFMAPKQLTVSGFADELRISRKHLSDIVNGHVRITKDVAARLGWKLGTSATLWLNLQNSVDAYDAEQDLQRLHGISQVDNG